VEDEIEPVDTPNVFLEALSKRMKEEEGVDADLAEILKKYILKALPAHDAVAQAKNEILQLASERANPPKSEVANA